MNILLCLISFIFSFIFFIFHRLSVWERFLWWHQTQIHNFTSISWNLIIESVIFWILGVILALYFSWLNFLKIKSEKPIAYSDKDSNDWENIKRNVFSNMSVKSFFKEYVYYIGFIFFYFSVYLFLKSLWIHTLSYFILFLNIVIAIFFFLTNKSHIFKDFIRVNTILFSLYYIGLYFCIIFLDLFSLGMIDIVNTIFILSFFVITLYFDIRPWQDRQSDSPMVSYFFVYSFIVFSFYLKIFLDWLWIHFIHVFTCIWVVFNIWIYFFLLQLQFFQNSLYILRWLSFIFLYISMISSALFLYTNFSNFWIYEMICCLVLIYGIIFHIFAHLQFQNYISLSFSLSSSVFLSLYLSVMINNHFLFIDMPKLITIICLSISFFLVTLTYVYRQKFTFDFYFIHVYWYVLIISGIIYFFYYWQRSMLDISIILLLGSIFIFMSSYKLRNLWKRETQDEK